jgi:hypothetical protein
VLCCSACNSIFNIAYIAVLAASWLLLPHRTLQGVNAPISSLVGELFGGGPLKLAVVLLMLISAEPKLHLLMMPESAEPIHLLLLLLVSAEPILLLLLMLTSPEPMLLLSYIFSFAKPNLLMLIPAEPVLLLLLMLILLSLIFCSC